MLLRWLALIASALLVVACGGGLIEPSDGPGVEIRPDQVVRLSPRLEPRAKYGNHSPYTVYGRRYRVMDSSRGYQQTGTASWYGSKFHGRKTSSGEPYDMYRMTAAHRHLPLPTWVQVENLDNGRSAIVKVNDRGPFVHDRVIDLSYGAAVVLGVKNAGTARVRVTAIDFIDGQPMLDGRLLATAETQAAPRRERLPAAQPIRASAPVLVPAKLESSAAAAVPAASAPISATTVTPAAAPVAAAAPPAPLRPAPVASVERAYLQFGAFAERDRAYALRSKISQQAEVSGVHVLRHWRNGNPLYRVRMGPFGSESDLQTAQLAMQRAGVAQYRVVRE